MFGTSVIDFTDIIEGTAGYIIRMDATQLLCEKAKSVQAQIADDDTPEGVTAEVTQDVLFNYLNSDSAPDLAFNQSYNNISIFFNTTAFPYVDTTRFDVKFYRLTQVITDDDEEIDVPDGDIELVILICKRLVYLTKGVAVPEQLTARIEVLETAIQNEV